MDEKYLNGKIYKLKCNITGMVYYGSTIQTLSKRLSEHKSLYKNQCLKESKRYCMSYDIIKNDNYEIKLVENYPCDNKRQLELRERYFIENNECINKTIPTRSMKEYGKMYRQLETTKERKRIAYRELYKIKIECPNCKAEVSKIYLKKHQKTKKCKNLSLEKTTN